jgi:hypothetical protein
MTETSESSEMKTMVTKETTARTHSSATLVLTGWSVSFQSSDWKTFARTATNQKVK